MWGARLKPTSLVVGWRRRVLPAGPSKRPHIIRRDRSCRTHVVSCASGGYASQPYGHAHQGSCLALRRSRHDQRRFSPTLTSVERTLPPSSDLELQAFLQQFLLRSPKLRRARRLYEQLDQPRPRCLIAVPGENDAVSVGQCNRSVVAKRGVGRLTGRHERRLSQTGGSPQAQRASQVESEKSLLFSLRGSRLWRALAGSTTRRLVTAALLVLATLMSKLVWIPGVWWPVRYGFRFVLGLLASALLVEHVLNWSSKKYQLLPVGSRTDWPGDFRMEFAGPRYLTQLATKYWAAITFESILTFTSRVTRPWDSRLRIIEDIRLGPRFVQRTVNVQYRTYDSDFQERTLLPYARPLKGDVLANLTVTDNRGYQLRTLSYEETTSFLFICLQFTFTALSGYAGLSNAQARQALRHFALVVTKNQLREHHLRKIRTQLAGYLSIDRDAEEWQTFTELLYVCAMRRPLIAQMRLAPSMRPSATDVHELTYSYDQPVSIEERETRYADAYEQRKQRMRQAALLHPTLLSLDVGSSRACRSYQARVRPPIGTYICETGMVDATRGRAIPNLTHGAYYDSFVSWRPRPEEGSSDLHATNLHRSSALKPRLIIRLAEVPPGSLGRAVVISFAVLFTIWITGVLFSGVVLQAAIKPPTATSASSGAGTIASSHVPQRPTSRNEIEQNEVGQATDVVAFVLGVPAVLGAWIALTSGKGTEFVSLAGRLSLTCTAALSVLSAALYLLHANKHWTILKLPGDRSVLLIREWVWAGLFYSCIGRNGICNDDPTYSVSAIQGS
jgi:hypothetical protein